MKTDALFQAVKALPLDQVMSRYLPLTPRGSRYAALCPFHPDRNLGSFLVEPAKGTWRCYACGEGGDAADFVAKLCGVSPREAALRIAEENGLLSPADAGAMRRGERMSPALRVPRVPARLAPNQKREPEQLHLVYRAFVRAAGGLSQAHLSHLTQVRQVGEYLDDFFEWPEENAAFWRRFDAQLRDAGSEVSLVSAISRVPGFHFDLSEMRPGFCVHRRGIGIVQRDAGGRISGLQVRLDDDGAGDGCRYKLFSSSYAQFNRDGPLIDGASCRSVVDIVRPRHGPVRGYAVTEGHFKAVQLAKRGCATLSLNGISSWPAVLDALLDLVRADGRGLPVHLCLDSDILSNPGVAKAGAGLYAAISAQGIPARFVSWDPSCGKGIDDVLLAGRSDGCRIRDPGKFLEVLEKVRQTPDKKLAI